MANLNISPPVMGFTVNKPTNALGTGVPAPPPGYQFVTRTIAGVTKYQTRTVTGVTYYEIRKAS